MERVEATIEGLRSGGVAVLSDGRRFLSLCCVRQAAPLLLAEGLEKPGVQLVAAQDRCPGADPASVLSCGARGDDPGRRLRQLLAWEAGEPVSAQASGCGAIGLNVIRGGGVLLRPGLEAAALDLAQLAGGQLALCWEAAASEQASPELILSVQDVVTWRFVREPLVKAINTVDLPSEHGRFRLHVYEVSFDPSRGIDLALTCGTDRFDEDETVLVRVHAEWSIANIVRHLAGGSDLDRAMCAVAAEGRGVIIFLRNTPEQVVRRDLFGELGAIPPDIWSEDGRLCTLAPPADAMGLGIGAQMLRDLGVRKMRLLSNNPQAVFAGLEHFGMTVVERRSF